MYYEERVIDGVLHWRGTPDGPWQKMTDEQLTQKLEEERARKVAFRDVAYVFLEYLETGSAGDILCDDEECECKGDYIKELRELLGM